MRLCKIFTMVLVKISLISEIQLFLTILGLKVGLSSRFC